MNVTSQMRSPRVLQSQVEGTLTRLVTAAVPKRSRTRTPPQAVVDVRSKDRLRGDEQRRVKEHLLKIAILLAIALLLFAIAWMLRMWS
jgi:hypothetical protein